MARLDEITSSIYRINTAMDGGFSFNQYLIKDEKNILIHTGSVAMFKDVSARLAEVLDATPLDYIFISHFESDECGALSNFQTLYLKMVPLCSAVTARQLQGFAIHGSPHVVKPGEELNLGSRKLSFISYPSEMHLWEGLLACDVTDKVLFSSDLFVVRGAGDSPLHRVGAEEALTINPRSIPDDDARQKCEAEIRKLDIELVAVGHGPVLDIRA